MLPMTRDHFLGLVIGIIAYEIWHRSRTPQRGGP